MFFTLHFSLIFSTILMLIVVPVVRPTNVKYVPINGTAVTVTWDPVPNTREAVRGQILGYQVHNM